MKKKQMVMTVRIRKEVADSVNRAFRTLRFINRDPYLNVQLSYEIEELAKRDPNSEQVLQYLRYKHAAQDVERVKLGLKLDRDLVTRITTVCEEKRVPRDLFIETFLDFLVNGDRENIGSPLWKAVRLLEDPLWEAWGDTNIYSGCFYPDWIVDFFKDPDAQGDAGASRSRNGSGEGK
jgi:hypothetical protein